MKKWELSILIGAAAAILCCAFFPQPLLCWWTTAFEPLCDGLISAETATEGVVLRSKLWELLQLLFA